MTLTCSFPSPLLIYWPYLIETQTPRRVFITIMFSYHQSKYLKISAFLTVLSTIGCRIPIIYLCIFHASILKLDWFHRLYKTEDLFIQVDFIKGNVARWWLLPLLLLLDDYFYIFQIYTLFWGLLLLSRFIAVTFSCNKTKFLSIIIIFKAIVFNFLITIILVESLEKELKQYGVVNYVRNNTIYLSKSKYIRWFIANRKFPLYIQ